MQQRIAAQTADRERYQERRKEATARLVELRDEKDEHETGHADAQHAHYRIDPHLFFHVAQMCEILSYAIS